MAFFYLYIPFFYCFFLLLVKLSSGVHLEFIIIFFFAIIKKIKIKYFLEKITQGDMVSINMDTMVEAVKYASQYIKNSESNIELLLTSLKEYAIVSRVVTKVLPNTKIQSPLIEITNPNEDNYLKIEDINWDNFFVKKEDLFTTNTSFFVEEHKDELDSNVLTKDLVKQYSIVKDGVINSEELFYGDDVLFDFDNIFLNEGNVLSYKETEQIALPKNKTLEINKLNQWKININIENVKITNNKKNNLKIDGLYSNNKLLLKNVNFTNGQFSEKKLKENFVGEDRNIDKYARIPDGAIHNILTAKDIIEPDEDSNLPTFKKTNDSLILLMEEEQDFAVLSSSIDNNIANTKTNELFFENENYLIQKRNLSQTISKLIASYQN